MKSNVKVNATLIKKLRHALGLSQSDMATACLKKRLNIALSTIKRVESGKSVSLRTLRNIALFFQCPIEELIDNVADDSTNRIRDYSGNTSSFMGGDRSSAFLHSWDADFELEQFSGILKRTTKLGAPHLLCLKSSQVEQTEHLLNRLVHVCKLQNVPVHEVMVKEDGCAWYQPLDQLLSQLIVSAKLSTEHHVTSQLLIEKKTHQWAVDIAQIIQLDSAPRVILINHFDFAHQLFINSLANLIYQTKRQPLLYVAIVRDKLDNLAHLQRNLPLAIPNLTMELPELHISPSKNQLMASA